MEYYAIIAYLALALSVATTAFTLIVIPRVYRYVKLLVDELGVAVLSRKRYRKVKRYILVKFVCLDNSYESLANTVKQRVAELLGPILRHRCSVDVVSYRSSSRRAILRVRGETVCVVYTLLALSIQHIGGGSCIAIPIRTSGLISRLRHRYLRSS